MRNIQKILLGFALLSPLASQAAVECAGETYKGAIVQVFVNTVGTMGYVQEGRVEIQDENGKKSSYTIKRDDIPQFFERTEGENEQKALVFLQSYVDTNYPVSIRYIGTNYGDVLKALHNPARKKEAGNEMRVWKGPGFEGGQQYQFTDVVCLAMLDP